MEARIGIIGFGNMGSSIAERLKKEYPLFVFDKDKEKTCHLSGLGVSQNAIDLVKECAVIILAVKPQDFSGLLNTVKEAAADKLVISIAAGISTNFIEKKLTRARVIRAMPNLAAKIGKSIVCLAEGRSAQAEDLNLAQSIFKKLGQTLVIRENLMDAATAICGSGPGFLYHCLAEKNKDEIKKFAEESFLPRLQQVASNVGFTPEEARLLAEATVSGSIAFWEASQMPAAELARRVASKGGTTEAGLEVLRQGGALEEAVKAALKRAKELSQKIV